MYNHTFNTIMRLAFLYVIFSRVAADSDHLRLTYVALLVDLLAVLPDNGHLPDSFDDDLDDESESNTRIIITATVKLV